MIAVITGASSGIGRATALAFAREGYDVAVLARRRELLESLLDEMKAVSAKGRYLAVSCDVSQTQDVQEAANQVSQKLGDAHVLVNNAGAFEYAPFEKSSAQKTEEMIDVNVRGVIYVTKAFLPALKKTGTPKAPSKVINVSSISGLWGFSNMAVYTASKFAVTGLSSALSRELKHQNIRVSAIHPGPVRTKESPSGAAKKTMTMLPPQIADQIVSLAGSSRRRLISHPVFTVLHWLDEVSPVLVDRVLKKIL